MGPNMNSVHILTPYFLNIRLTYLPVYKHLSSEERPRRKYGNEFNYYMGKLT
jgi:hypothetical protein